MGYAGINGQCHKCAKGKSAVDGANARVPGGGMSCLDCAPGAVSPDGTSRHACTCPAPARHAHAACAIAMVMQVVLPSSCLACAVATVPLRSPARAGMQCAMCSGLEQRFLPNQEQTACIK